MEKNKPAFNPEEIKEIKEATQTNAEMLKEEQEITGEDNRYGISTEQTLSDIFKDMSENPPSAH